LAARWATFDCYGTLVDWNGGIRRELVRLFGVGAAPRLLARYHELEPEVEAERFRSYRDVLTETLARLVAAEGLDLPQGEADALARSLPAWDVFPEVPAALEEARRRGWRLAILSNSDRDLIAASKERIGVPFDETVVAQEVSSYKPAHGHWQEFFRRTGAERDRHVHVAASLFHDIAPANELGLPSVWINRLGDAGSTESPKSGGAGFAGAGAGSEHSGPHPTRELSSLAGLADVLDELAPAA
jgi:2-haloacid dehalogenase